MVTNLGLSKRFKELIQFLVESCVPFVDVPHLSLDCEVMNCTEYDFELLFCHQTEVMHNIA